MKTIKEIELQVRILEHTLARGNMAEISNLLIDIFGDEHDPINEEWVCTKNYMEEYLNDAFRELQQMKRSLDGFYHAYYMFRKDEVELKDKNV
jgi:protein tyrosine/serine phosphatase